MKSEISDKDKNDWEEFLLKDEKLPNKDNFEKKKKRGKIKSLDLHGYTLDDANQTIENFIKKSYEDNISKLVIITGKGIHSDNEKDPYVSKDLGILKYSTVLASTNELGGIIHSDPFFVIKFVDLKFFGSTISELTLVNILNSSETLAS